VSVHRLAAAWIVLLSLACIAFVALNASAIAAQGRPGPGDVLVSVLLLVLAGSGARVARRLWRGDAGGRREAVVVLACAAVASLWLAMQAPLGFVPLVVTALVLAALLRSPRRD
jgi:hypothetical protein